MAITANTSHHPIGFIAHFSKLEDPRQINTSLYPSQEVLLLALTIGRS